MAKLPILQEIGTCFLSLGDAICGEPEKARERWADYAKESLIGSYCVATHHAIHGNEAKAEEYLKGMGRATGQALLGGGLLESVPGFQEIATCGKSLGDMIGGGDDETARKRWNDYAENSTVGSFCYAIHEDIHGNHEHAEKLLKNSGKSLINGTVTVGTVALTAATGGLAAPLGVPAAAAVGGATGVVGSVAGTGTSDLLYGNVSGGDYVGGALFGGISGAASGAMQAKAYEKVNVAKTDGYYLKQNEKYLEGNKDATRTLMTYENENGTRGGSFGHSARDRTKQFGRVTDAKGKLLSKGDSANYAGSPSYPRGYDNVSRIFEEPTAQNYLQEHGAAKWCKTNCAEPHALETIKANNPGATVKSNYTLGADRRGNITVKQPCNNCAAAGDHYGRVPFAKYDRYTVNDAIKAHVGEAKAGCVKSAVISTAMVATGAEMSKGHCPQSDTEDEDEENAKNK